ncbi:TetR/AcrR family transcriptional regulator [Anaerorhabdus furcosa]|uniref:Transcriptional regulator, TetR family n=1 Tax=Anaerorhabdus furcosa TaxID=118967 RepID=A0A1T4P744_9FIRM|nr:TetR/AcrR family transcriptional regulator [Anaerorhabdus furcosa]SJZ86728.1 transcriptional regulator, TetR family [Anaerorhabdus furcosa]
MAQVLKEEVRNSILKSADAEIMANGIQGIQMRRIAEGANMTVGNLYRYFEDKEALINAIVEPALYDLDELLKRISNSQISLLKETSDLDMDKIYLNLEICAMGLADIFNRHQCAMLLISSTNELKAFLIWIKEVLRVGLRFKESDMSEEDLDFLCSLISISVVKGMQECFRIALESPEKAKNLDRVILKYLQIVLWK